MSENWPQTNEDILEQQALEKAIAESLKQEQEQPELEKAIEASHMLEKQKEVTNQFPEKKIDENEEHEKLRRVQRGMSQAENQNKGKGLELDEKRKLGELQLAADLNTRFADKKAQQDETKKNGKEEKMANASDDEQEELAAAIALSLKREEPAKATDTKEVSYSELSKICLDDDITALQELMKQQHSLIKLNTTDKFNLLSIVVNKSNIEILKFFIEKQNFKPKAEEADQLLLAACRAPIESVAIVTYLIEHFRANKNANDGFGDNALAIAQQKGHQNIIDYLKLAQ